MLKSTTFFLALLWAIAKGMTRNLSLFSLLLIKRNNKKISIVIPNREIYRNREKTVFWEEFAAEKETTVIKRNFQVIFLSSMPKPQKFFLN